MNKRWSFDYKDGIYSSPCENVYFLPGNCWDFSGAIDEKCHQIEAEEVTAYCLDDQGYEVYLMKYGKIKKIIDKQKYEICNFE